MSSARLPAFFAKAAGRRLREKGSRNLAHASVASTRGLLPRDAGAAIFGQLPVSVDAGVPKAPAAKSPVDSGRFYLRSLPQAQVPFSSSEGRKLFNEALLAGTMENYFILAEQFRTQDEPTFCGLTTIAMVLNSLRIDPMRTWKGVWRWFNEQNLGCCTGPEQVRESGLTFDMFKCLAACNGANVAAHRAPVAPEFSPEQRDFTSRFREAVRATSRSTERECIVLCYSREALGQSGAGHFSPIGGYHEGTDSVLIMDVARFKYPPHWARVEDVAAAMGSVDNDTGRTRGFLHLRLLPSGPEEQSRNAELPLHLSFLPPAAGKRLSWALAEAVEKGPTFANDCVLQGCDAASVQTMLRWLTAVSRAEPQVLGQLLAAGDTSALLEVLGRLRSGFAPFRNLCSAYALLTEGVQDGVRGDFPPLLFSDGEVEPNGHLLSANDEPRLGLCGEVWVLMLLLLPEHLRAAISQDLAGPWVARGIARAVRGPWALPLEALREALGHTLDAQRCPSPPQGSHGRVARVSRGPRRGRSPRRGQDAGLR